MKTYNVVSPVLAAGAMCCGPVMAAEGGVSAARADSRPNMVLVLIDDTGWGTFAPNIVDFSLSQMNQDFIQLHVKDYTPEEAVEAARKAMPNLSQLCAEGVRFRNAYVTANVSSPSRAGLLTSSYQQRYGLYVNQESEAGIPTNIKLMPQVLKEAGYVNGIFGKYHNGCSSDETKSCAPGHHPLDRGFDVFYGFNNAGTEYYDSEIIYRNRTRVKPEKYLTDQFTDEAVAFIEEHKGVPKLVYVPYNALHGPLGAPAPEKYRQRFHYASPTLNNYAAYTAAVDDGVARIMDKMREIGEADNTILVFLADNGAPGGAAATLPKNGPFSGFKGQSWQGGYHIPMFIWFGKNIAPGRVCDQVVSSMDIFPTLLDYAGIPLPEGQVVDGRSLRGLLDGTSDAPVHDHLVWMFQHAENWGMNKIHDQQFAQGAFAVRQGDFVLRYVIQENRFYLHNVTEDPAEKTDLAAQYPEKVEQMKGLFKAWFAQMKKPNEWKPELWQNVQFWDTSLPSAPKIDYSTQGMEKVKKNKKK